MNDSWSTAIVLAVDIVLEFKPLRSWVRRYEATSLISLFFPIEDALELSRNVLYFGTNTMFDVYTGWSMTEIIPASSNFLHVFFKNVNLS